MRVSECVACKDFPCMDVNHAGYRFPVVELDPQQVKMILIAEASAQEAEDDFYAGNEALFWRTTALAFEEAGVPLHSVGELLDRGIYLTSAVKCSKTAYGIQLKTVQTCALLLEQELALFPNVQVYMLMGDVAIQAVNYLARRGGKKRVIPAGATYKLRGGEFFFHGRRALPSYLQAGPSSFIEKSKRRMIVEDLKLALGLIK